MHVRMHSVGCPGEEKPLDSIQAKALTEEDVHNWKRRLRSAKSAESLLSMATSARSSISSHTSSSMSNAEAGRQRGMAGTRLVVSVGFSLPLSHSQCALSFKFNSLIWCIVFSGVAEVVLVFLLLP